MGNLKFNERVGKVEPAEAARKLNLTAGQNREVPKAKDGLGSGDKSLSEVAHGGGDD